MFCPATELRPPETSRTDAEDAVTVAEESSQTIYIWPGLTRPFTASPPTETLRKSPLSIRTEAEPETKVTQAPSASLRPEPAANWSSSPAPEPEAASSSFFSAASTMSFAQFSA